MARRPAKRYRPRFHDVVIDPRLTLRAALTRYRKTGDLKKSGIEIRRLPGIKSSPAVRSERDSIRAWFREGRLEDLSAGLRVKVMAEYRRGRERDPNHRALVASRSGDEYPESQAQIARLFGITRLQVNRIIQSWTSSRLELDKLAPKGELEEIHRTRKATHRTAI